MGNALSKYYEEKVAPRVVPKNAGTFTDSLKQDAGGIAKNYIGPLGQYIGDKFDGIERNKKGEKEAKERLSQQQADQYEWNKTHNTSYDVEELKYRDKMDKADTGFKSARNASVNPHLERLAQLEREANAQATDSRATYEGSIKPGMMEQMNRAQTEARSAMSLKDYMDPNNAVAKGTRDLYDTEAQGVGKQGLADVGVLSAMGANAASQAFGTGGPMSTGQLQSLYAANQSQSGQAFANVQKRMQALKEQGLAKGFEQSDKAYQAGERAGQRASGTIKDLSDAEAAQLHKQGTLRAERGGIGADIMGLNLGTAQSDYAIGQGAAGRNLDMGYRKLDRQSTTENTRYGTNAQQEANEIMRRQAMGEGDRRTIGSIAGAAGTAIGSIYGGPAGGAAGGAMGKAVEPQGPGVQNPYGGNAYMNQPPPGQRYA